jgi:hypothetical protein
MSAPKHRPPRTQLIVRAGDAAAAATVPEWWGALGSDTQSRRLRFAGGGRQWLDAGVLPPALADAGCFYSDVVGTDDLPGLAHPELVTGARVLLRPRRVGGGGTAIEVWVDSEPVHVGYLPPDVAGRALETASRYQTGFGAIVASETRARATKERRSVTVVLGPVAMWAEPAEAD